jgi:3-methylcrotonyl-CoA carboxylase beta subunit
MGGEQAAQTLVTVKVQQLAERGETLDDAGQKEIAEPILSKFEHEGSPYYSTSRLWDDGILDPVETRDVLGLAIAIALGTAMPATRFGVFRM